MKKAIIDIKHIRHMNYMNESRMRKCIELANKLKNDPDNKERLQECKCLVCYYIDRIAGDAMTTSECSYCRTVLHSSNTDTDVLCIDCAKNSNLCKHCGCDLTKV